MGKAGGSVLQVLIVYDSVFGNTEKVATALKESVTAPHRALIVKVDNFTVHLLDGVDLLLVGSPTHGFKPTEAITLLFKGFSKNTLAGIKVAAFDTRISVVEVKSKVFSLMTSLFGYAADSITKALVKHGGVLVSEAHWFIVRGKEGPLRQGEVEHARTWITQLLAVDVGSNSFPLT